MVQSKLMKAVVFGAALLIPSINATGDDGAQASGDNGISGLTLNHTTGISHYNAIPIEQAQAKFGKSSPPPPLPPMPTKGGGNTESDNKSSPSGRVRSKTMGDHPSNLDGSGSPGSNPGGLPKQTTIVDFKDDDLEVLYVNQPNPGQLDGNLVAHMNNELGNNLADKLTGHGAPPKDAKVSPALKGLAIATGVLGGFSAVGGAACLSHALTKGLENDAIAFKQHTFFQSDAVFIAGVFCVASALILLTFATSYVAFAGQRKWAMPLATVMIFLSCAGAVVSMSFGDIGLSGHVADAVQVDKVLDHLHDHTTNVDPQTWLMVASVGVASLVVLSILFGLIYQGIQKCRN